MAVQSYAKWLSGLKVGDRVKIKHFMRGEYRVTAGLKEKIEMFKGLAIVVQDREGGGGPYYFCAQTGRRLGKRSGQYDTGSIHQWTTEDQEHLDEELKKDKARERRQKLESDAKTAAHHFFGRRVFNNYSDTFDDVPDAKLKKFIKLLEV